MNPIKNYHIFASLEFTSSSFLGDFIFVIFGFTVQKKKKIVVFGFVHSPPSFMMEHWNLRNFQGIGRCLYEELRKRLQNVGVSTIFCWGDKESERFWLKQVSLL